MTKPLFIEDAYAQSATGRVVAHPTGGGVVLDQSLFYATGGGQPGDSGRLKWDGGTLNVQEAVKGDQGQIVFIPEPGQDVIYPPIGTQVVQQLHWERRLAHMRMHTALHLLSVVIPLPVTGGAITADKGRIDFAMPDPPEDKAALEDRLNLLIARDLGVSESWISDAELAANPGLVKTMSVSPPTGAGQVRLVRIGTQNDQIDLQPCGGTHVARTSEIGRVRLGKIVKKGHINRRVYLHPAL